MTIVWDLANGAGIPALSDAIDVCLSKRRALSDKRSVLLTAGGVRFWSKERSNVARNRAMGGQRGP